MQNQIEYSPRGIFIPFEWFKEMGRDVHVQKIGQVIVIESSQHEALRKHLQTCVQQLRETGEDLEILSEDEITAIVNEIRESRACCC